jgi:hypothetical protein
MWADITATTTDLYNITLASYKVPGSTPVIVWEPCILKKNEVSIVPVTGRPFPTLFLVYNNFCT